MPEIDNHPMIGNRCLWIPFALCLPVMGASENEKEKVRENAMESGLVDARPYAGLTHKDAILAFVASMTKTDLAVDRTEGISHFILVAPSRNDLADGKSSLKKERYEKSALIHEIVEGAGLKAGITGDRLVVSPSGPDEIQRCYAGAEKLSSAAKLKSCKLAAMDADELALKDALGYLNERLKLSGSDLNVTVDAGNEAGEISMYYKNTTAFDCVVLIASASGLVIDQVDEKSWVLKKVGR